MSSSTEVSRDERREKRQKIAEAVRGGMTGPEAARHFEVSIAQVRLACLEYDVPVSFSAKPQRTALAS